MDHYLATVTNPALQGPLVIRLVDSVPAGSMSSVGSAQSVLQDTTASPTADVSKSFVLPVLVRLQSLARTIVQYICLNPLSLSLASTACECGRRLCDEVTGNCICPPQTVKPSCDVCQTQSFSYHPLLGCEGCECSQNGIKDQTRPECDPITGQCR